MKIAIFTDCFYPMINGIVTSTIAYIKELGERGHEILVFCPSNKGYKNIKLPNTELIGLRGIPAFFYPEFKFTTFTTPKVVRKIKKFNPDVIRFHTQFVIGLKGILVSKIFRKPLIGTYHTKIADKDYLKNIKLDKFKMAQKYARKYNKFYYTKAHLILAPSIDSKGELIKSGIYEEKINILYNPIPFSDKPTIQYKYTSKIKGDIILYIGRISNEKSIDHSLEVFSEVLKKCPKTHYILVGDGPIRKKMIKYSDKLGINKNVHFLGSIEHPKLMNSDLMFKTKIFFTTSGSEICSITAIEASYFGIPLVGINKGGTKERVTDGYNGFIRKPGDIKGLANNIIKLLEDEKLQKKMSKNSKKESKKYNIHNLTDQLVNYFNQTIDIYKAKYKKKSNY